MRRSVAAAASAALLLLTTASYAADEHILKIKDHVFSPEKLEVPAGTRVKVTITNTDGSAEEFDSPDLHVEKLVPAGQTASVFV